MRQRTSGSLNPRDLRPAAGFFGLLSFGMAVVVLVLAGRAGGQGVVGASDLSPAEAAVVFEEEFADELPGSDARTIEPLAGESVIRFRNDREAVVDEPGPAKGLVVSNLPLRTDHAGDMRPLELTLDERASGFAPANGLIGSQVLPSGLDAGIEAGRGVELDFVGADEHDPDGRLAAANALFYPNVTTDTDVALQPLPRGLEAAVVLRSHDSPLAHELRIGAPAGSQTHLESSGSISITDEGRQIAVILPPRARDAGGTYVPSWYTLDGDLATLHVDPNEGTEFPILVDPELWEPNTSDDPFYHYGVPGSLPSYSDWVASSNDADHDPGFMFSNAGSIDYDSGDGNLYSFFQSSDASIQAPDDWFSGQGPDATTLATNDPEDAVYGEWSWTAPVGYYISAAQLLGAWGMDGSRVSSGQAFRGLWSGQAGEFADLDSDELELGGDLFDSELVSTDPTTRRAVVGMLLDPAYGNAWVATDLSAATIYLTSIGDTTDPSLDVGGAFAEANALVGAEPEVEVEALDAGSGVTSVALLVDEEEIQSVGDECPDAGCSFENTLTPDLSELEPGEHDWEIVAEDAAGNSADESGTFELDPAVPHLAVVGDLVDSSGSPLLTSTADAAIAASDEETGDSGVASLTVTVDDEIDMTDPQDCDPACPEEAEGEYTFTLGDWSGGNHIVIFKATDAAGNVAVQEVDVNPPAETPAVCPETSPSIQEDGTVITGTAAATAAIDEAVASSESAYDEMTGTTVDPSLEPGLDTPPDPLSLADSLATGTVESTGDAIVNLDYSMCLVPLQTTEDQTNASVVNGDVAVYANSASDTDTVIRPDAAGATVIQSIRGPEAPESYSWEVGVPDGTELETLASGGIAIVDPNEEAPAEPDVPAQAEGAMDPEEIPAVDRQLEQQAHEIAQAEDETGQRVIGVIATPYLVDNGDADAATLTLIGDDVIEVDAGPDEDALVMPLESSLDRVKAPDRSRAFPINQAPGNIHNDVKQAACEFENNQGAGRDFMILDFGRVGRRGNNFGAGTNPFSTNPQIFDLLKAAAHEYNDCRGNDSHSVSIIYANNNHSLTSELSSQAGAANAGQAQWHVAEKLRQHNDPHVSAGVGGDLEPGWDPSGGDWARELMHGASGPGRRYYNYGTAGPCPPVGNDCTDTWGYIQIGKMSQDQNAASLPQIYNPVDAQVWERVANHWDQYLDRCPEYPNRTCYYFTGSTGQPRECPGSLTPEGGWRQLRRVVDRRSVERHLIWWNPHGWGC